MIDVNQVNEKEGSITFVLNNFNFFTKDNLIILSFIKGNTIFLLEKTSDLKLRFIRGFLTSNTIVSEIDLKDFYKFHPKELFIALTWSPKEQAIYVGYTKNLIKGHSYQTSNIIFRKSRNGDVFRIETRGFQIGAYFIMNNGNVILEPTAKEIFDFHMERVKILLENCKKENFLFETTIAQQIIVMLVTAFEVYSRMRFLELEKEGKLPNIEELFKRFISTKYREVEIKQIRERAQRENKSELEVFVERRYINFQNWDDFKDAYNKGYNLRIGDINISSQIITEIKKFLKWRHKIIHANKDLTIIDYDNNNPIFTTKELAEKGLEIFKKFIDEFHKETLQL